MPWRYSRKVRSVVRSRDLEHGANQLVHQLRERLPIRALVQDTEAGLKTRQCDGADQVVDAVLIYSSLRLLRWYDRSDPAGLVLLVADLPVPLRGD
jgi:hypothetical protein